MDNKQLLCTETELFEFFEALVQNEFQNWNTVKVVKAPFGEEALGPWEHELPLAAAFSYNMRAFRCLPSEGVLHERMLELDAANRIATFKDANGELVALGVYFEMDREEMLNCATICLLTN